jgi:type IV pilus assembly protein PilB
MSSVPSHYHHSVMINEAIDFETPLIKQLNTILVNAIEKKASDIHLEPFQQGFRLRYRIDGLLNHIDTLSTAEALRLITRLKVLANLDISEKRLPQDGGFQLSVGGLAINMRMNSCPLINGEKIVIRIINNNQFNFNLEQLSLNNQQTQLVLTKLALDQGLILISGSTGSGKTVTLYTLLNHLNTLHKNIVTIENPVEFELAGINQMNTQTKIGLTFSQLLRSVLRQDPDVIMIGEIRDLETADIALQAAQTGHLILSTIHANSAKDVIKRLQSLGLPTEDIQQCLALVISQKLIRKLCDVCKYESTENAKTFMAKGCEHCQQGYSGRVGVYELLATDNHTTTHYSFHQAFTEKLVNGITSANEIQRFYHD